MAAHAVAARTVIIGEDRPVLADALVDTTAHLYGLTVLDVASTRRDTLAAATQHRPDLVVFDLALAGPSGLGVIDQVRDAAPGAAVVLLAPHAYAALAVDAVAAGAVMLGDTADLRALQCGIERLTLVHGESCPTCAARATERFWGRD